MSIVDAWVPRKSYSLCVDMYSSPRAQKYIRPTVIMQSWQTKKLGYYVYGNHKLIWCLYEIYKLTHEIHNFVSQTHTLILLA